MSPPAPPSPTALVRDASLLQHLRRLTVEERLALNDAAMRAALELRRAFAASRQDFGDFDFKDDRCSAGGLFFRGSYSAGGKVLACGVGSSTLYGQYRSDSAENPPTAPGAAFRSGYFTISIAGTSPGIRFTGVLAQWLGGAPENAWGGACSGSVCNAAAPPSCIASRPHQSAPPDLRTSCPGPWATPPSAPRRLNPSRRVGQKRRSRRSPSPRPHPRNRCRRTSAD